MKRRKLLTLVPVDGSDRQAQSRLPVDGQEVLVQARHIEAISWADGYATVTMVPSHDVASYRLRIDLSEYNALVAEWALSAPGRSTSRRFAIRADARAKRLTGAEMWPRKGTEVAL